MAGASTNDDGLVSGINVTPFVDVVLVLLVALMVAATDIAAQTLSVDLPRAASGAEAPPRTLAITIDPRGALFLDGRPTDEAGLRAATRDARAKDPEVRATLAADGKVPHEHVVRVMDVLRQESVLRFALQVQPPR